MQFTGNKAPDPAEVTNLKSDYPRKVVSMCRRPRRYASTSNKFVPVVPDAHEAQRGKGRTLTWVTITLTLLLSSAPHVTRSETQARSLCGLPRLYLLRQAGAQGRGVIINQLNLTLTYYRHEFEAGGSLHLHVLCDPARHSADYQPLPTATTITYRPASLLPVGLAGHGENNRFGSSPDD